MMCYRQLLPLALVALLLLSACELVDAVEVAVSGPHCGKSGMPSELEERGLYLFDGPRDWDQIDEMVAALEPYEGGHGPDILFALGVSYLRKANKLSDDPAYYRRGVRLLAWSALCGQPLAAYYLGNFYNEGLAGVDKDPELGACLIRLHDLNNFEPRTFEDGPVSGRVWGCGRLRVSLACPDSEWLDPRRNVFELGGKLPPALRKGLEGTLRGAVRAWKVASGDSAGPTGLLRPWASVSLRVHDFRR